MGKKHATLCGGLGHWWQPTTANERRCGRVGCAVMERWDGRRWVRVPGGVLARRQGIAQPQKRGE